MKNSQLQNHLIQQISDFFPSLRHEISLLEKTFNPTANFPHKNIYAEYENDENGNKTENLASYNIEYALSGFNKEDIKIELNSSNNHQYISIHGSTKSEEENNKKHYYLKNISTRSFKEKVAIPFKTSEENISAIMENGILKVKITPVEIQANKKKIEIT